MLQRNHLSTNIELPVKCAWAKNKIGAPKSQTIIGSRSLPKGCCPKLKLNFLIALVKRIPPITYIKELIENTAAKKSARLGILAKLKDSTRLLRERI
jgi:hypothetical protein